MSVAALRSPPTDLMSGLEPDEGDIEAYLREEAEMNQQQPPPPPYAGPRPPTNSNQPAASSSANPKSAAAAKNMFQSHQPQKGKVLSITRTELFGTTRTVMKVLMEKGGERTINADGSNVRVDIDIDINDQVKCVQTGHLQMQWSRIVPVAEKVRKKRKVFDLDCLFSENGLPKLIESFPNLKWDTRPNCETKALTQIVMRYKEWFFQLFPRQGFNFLMERCEKLGSKGAIKRVLEELRYGSVPDWDEFREEQQYEGGEGGDGAKRVGKKGQPKVELNENAKAIEAAYAANLQSGIKPAKGSEEAEDEDAAMALALDQHSNPAAGGENIYQKNARERLEKQAQIAQRLLDEKEREKAAREEEEANTVRHVSKKRKIHQPDEEEEEMEFETAPAKATELSASQGGEEVLEEDGLAPAANSIEPNQDIDMEHITPEGEMDAFLSGDQEPTGMQIEGSGEVASSQAHMESEVPPTESQEPASPIAPAASSSSPTSPIHPSTNTADEPSTLVLPLETSATTDSLIISGSTDQLESSSQLVGEVAPDMEDFFESDDKEPTVAKLATEPIETSESGREGEEQVSATQSTE